MLANLHLNLCCGHCLWSLLNCTNRPSQKMPEHRAEYTGLHYNIVSPWRNQKFEGAGWAGIWVPLIIRSATAWRPKALRRRRSPGTWLLEGVATPSRDVASTVSPTRKYWNFVLEIVHFHAIAANHGWSIALFYFLNRVDCVSKPQRLLCFWDHLINN